MPEFDISVDLRGGYRSEQLDRRLRAIAPLLELRIPARITVDLSAIANLSAAALAVLTATINELQHRGLVVPGSRYVPPQNFRTRRWLARLDFERLVTGKQEALRGEALEGAMRSSRPPSGST